ncbi:MAG: tetratricopeptide repeat protein, partial [Acidobacteria bacterium]|nr:tetratricopeptide repeat protein [Acidobacteriota bacterium]
FEDGRGGNDMLAALKQTITICNRSIYDSSSEIAELRGMATTVALVAAMTDNRAIIGHVGDSRVYRFDGRELVCETQDHSEVSDAIRAGLITPAQAAHHPRRNVINRAVGAEQDVEADFKIVPLNDKTSFLLCSDGITRHLSDAELNDLMRMTGHPQKVCDRMKDLCFERGAEDNLTAVIVDFGERNYRELPARQAAVKQAQAVNGAPPNPSHNRGRIEVEVSGQDSAPPITGPLNMPKNAALSGRLTMLEMPAHDPEPRTPSMPPNMPSGEAPSGMPSMFAADRKANAQLGNAAAANENKGASNISFWDKPGQKKTDSSSAAAAASESFSTSSSSSSAGRDSMTMRDYIVVFFYLALLAAAFGFGRYFDEVVGWVTGEPVATTERNVAGKTVNADADLLAARQLFNAGRFDAAQKQFESLVGKAPSNPQYQLGLGAALAEAGKPAEALKPLQEAVRLDPKSSEGYVRLALAYSALKDQKNADDVLRRAAALTQ